MSDACAGYAAIALRNTYTVLRSDWQQVADDAVKRSELQSRAVSRDVPAEWTTTSQPGEVSFSAPSVNSPSGDGKQRSVSKSTTAALLLPLLAQGEYESE